VVEDGRDEEMRGVRALSVRWIASPASAGGIDAILSHGLIIRYRCLRDPIP